MSGIKDQRNIDALRKRLYERSIEPEHAIRHELPSVDVDVSRGWEGVKPLRPAPMVAEEVVVTEEEVVKKKFSYRIIILLASLGFFVVMAVVSSIYLFFGNNQISVKNVNLTIGSPLSATAGEKLPIQVSVSNQNSIPIESATLILNYPSGTKSADEQMRDLYEERIPIDTIAAGEAKNIPTNVILFGEENEEKEIRAAIEYRVQGSNGTFFKDAESIKVKINSSPIVIRVDSIEKVSSGQEMEIKLTLQSNAQVVQKNILISATYPQSFEFIKSEPQPVYGQNEWLIDEIAPESTKVVTIRGRVKGLEKETSEMQFSAGTPKSDNQFMMGSVLTKAKTAYVIEQPFMGVVIEINQDTDNKVVIEPDREALVRVRVTNTLSEAVYDMRVEISPKGNLIRDDLLEIQGGFYDSNTKVINWEVSGNSDLAKVSPGETREFSFSVLPDPKQNTAAFDVSTKVFARRVNESNAAEELVGTTLAEAKYSSEISIAAQVGRNDGSFTDTGSVPPVAGKETTYTVTFVAEAGVNDATGAIMTATIPQYVTYLNKYEGDGTVEFNPSSKQLRWLVGNIDSGKSKQLKVQLSLLPSTLQVGRNLYIVGGQELNAVDGFTGAKLRDLYGSLNNELSAEAGFAEGNGIVQSSQ